MTRATMPAGDKRRSLVIFDVDGVLFQGQFMIALARRRGMWTFLQAVWNCLLFDLGRIRLEKLLDRIYWRLRGMPWTEVCGVYRRMPITAGAAETIRALQSAGMRVILLTAGVPNPLVKDLARRLGADGGIGMHVHVRRDRITGRVSGVLTHSEGKAQLAARLVERYGIQWHDVIVIGDDPNNLPLIGRAVVSIGFHAASSVRRAARYLVDTDDLGGVLPYALGSYREGSDDLLQARRLWRHEILRKVLHMTAAAVPFLAARLPVSISLLLLSSAALYLVSEFCRVNGAPLPFVRRLSDLVMRRRERREVATGPLTLALGAFVCLWCLPSEIGLACILIAAIGDSVAAVVGQRWGRVAWPHNRGKTLEGSAVFSVSAIACALVYLPLPTALALTVLATFFESLPVQDWDNFLTPVGSGMTVAVLMGLF